MARSIPVIYNALVDEKENQTELANLLPIGDDFDQLEDDLSSSDCVASHEKGQMLERHDRIAAEVFVGMRKCTITVWRD